MITNPLKKYRCAKPIQAGKITDIKTLEDKVELEIDELDNIYVTKHWFQKYWPQINGYYIRYNNGHDSYLSNKTFKEGFYLLNE